MTECQADNVYVPLSFLLVAANERILLRQKSFWKSDVSDTQCD